MSALVFLWTDVLLWLLAAVAALLIWRVRRDPQRRATWRRVGARPLGMAAAVVCAAYLAIGLADSIHLRGDYGRALSLLDRAMGPVRTQVEKSYSVPFALTALSREMIERPDGTTRRDYPRLTYGGAHIASPEGRAGDIAWRAIAGALGGLALWVLVAALVTWRIAVRGRVSWSGVARRISRGETALAWRSALVTLAVLLALAGASAALAPHYHLFGTDKVGQDVFYQAVKGIRTGLVIGTLTTLIMLPFAVLLGVAAGYFRGWIDDIVQYLYTTLNSIPGVLLIAAAVLMLQVYMANHPESFASAAARADMRLLFLCIILGVTSWTNLARLLRGEALKLRELGYVEAARAFGVSHWRILQRHVLPNVMHIVLITVVLDFSSLVLAEAVLSYVGVGVDPSMNSWGNMINAARLEMAREPIVWWSLAAAFVFMFTLVLAANLFADAVRDAFDPRLREQAAIGEEGG